MDRKKTPAPIAKQQNDRGPKLPVIKLLGSTIDRIQEGFRELTGVCVFCLYNLWSLYGLTTLLILFRNNSIVLMAITLTSGGLY